MPNLSFFVTPFREPARILPVPTLPPSPGRPTAILPPLPAVLTRLLRVWQRVEGARGRLGRSGLGGQRALQSELCRLWQPQRHLVDGQLRRPAADRVR